MSTVRVNSVVGREPASVAALIRTRAVREFRDEVQAITDEAAREGYEYAKRFAPFSRGGLRRNLYVSESRYMPGGRGGGGNFQSTFGVDALKAPQARFLIEGTGIYRGLGRVHSLSSADMASPGYPLVPRNGKYMKFNGAVKPPYRKPIYRKSVLGQKIQDDWWYDAIEVARIIVATRLRFMDQRDRTSI